MYTDRYTDSYWYMVCNVCRLIKRRRRERGAHRWWRRGLRRAEKSHRKQLHGGVSLSKSTRPHPLPHTREL